MIQWIKDRAIAIDAASMVRAETFLVLQARYQALQLLQGIKAPAAIEGIFARVPTMAQGVTLPAYLSKVKNVIGWQDLDILEQATVDILLAGDLPEQLAVARLKYSQTVDAAEYSQFERTMIDLGTATLPLSDGLATQLRAELLAITQRIQYMRKTSPLKERKRATISNLAICSMFAGIVAVVVVFFLLGGMGGKYKVDAPLHSLLVVLTAGLVGGFVSVQQRLQQPNNVDPFYKWLELNASGLSLLLSPIIGMVFALLLFCILLGGFVTGELFPTFQSCASAAEQALKHCNAGDLARNAYNATPDSAASWAKLVVWSFAAGFLERLVPDILTRLATVAQKSSP